MNLEKYNWNLANFVALAAIGGILMAILYMSFPTADSTPVPMVFSLVLLFAVAIFFTGLVVVMLSKKKR